MNKKELAVFLECMALALRQAGYVAKSLQGKVENIGKFAEDLPNDSGAVRAKRAAKTIIDEMVQEILLLAASEILNKRKIVVDAEEYTPSIKLFSKKQTETTLVIDPIDGTYEYLSGSDSYSVCVGLIENGEVVSALVYFPVRDTLYFIDTNKRPYLAKDLYISGFKRATPLKAVSPEQSQSVYVNNRVSVLVRESLISAGYKVVDDIKSKITWPDAILKCLNGEFFACLFHTSQIRDLLLGAILSYVPGGYSLDWKGKPLAWPNGGRAPRAIFGVGKYPVGILKCLNKKEA